MKSKIIRITIFFICLIIGMTVLVTILSRSSESEDANSERIVDCNEISQLLEMGEYTQAQQKLTDFRQNLKNGGIYKSTKTTGIIICGLAVLCICIVFIYVYLHM